MLLGGRPRPVLAPACCSASAAPTSSSRAAASTRLVQRLALGELGHSATTTAARSTRRDDGLLRHRRARRDRRRSSRASARALGDLPGDAIVSERRVLAIEEQREEPGALARLLDDPLRRAGHGLPFYDQFGLRWLRPSTPRAGPRAGSPAATPALWMTRPPDPGLRLPLPDGRAAPPRPSPADRRPRAARVRARRRQRRRVDARRAAHRPRSRVASRTVADRLHDELGAPTSSSAWQIPLTGSLSHRYLALDRATARRPCSARCPARSTRSPPTGRRARSSRPPARTTLRVLAADEAVAGGLERLAVDELLGAPRRWKEDVARESEAVSYAEAAAALREALATQILLAPAGAAPPGPRCTPTPGTRPSGSRARAQAAARRGRAPAGRRAGGRLARGERTARGPHRALRRRGGRDPGAGRRAHADRPRRGDRRGSTRTGSRTAGEIVAGLEQRLPPELVVPPRATRPAAAAAGRPGRAPQAAPRWLVDTELKLLPERLDHGEEVLTLSEATMGTSARPAGADRPAHLLGEPRRRASP